MVIREVYSAYASIYESKVEEENIHEEYLDEDLEFVDDLTDEELDSLIEGILEDYLQEGYDIDEVEQVFVEYLEEAKVTYGHDSDNEDDDLVSKVKKKKDEKAKASADSKEATEKAQASARKARVASVERVKNAIGRVSRRIKAKVHQPLSGYAARHKLYPSVDKKGERRYDKSGKPKFLHKGNIQTKIATTGGEKEPGKSKEKRQELRSLVVHDLKKRYRAAKYDNAKKQVKAYQKATDKVRDLKDAGRTKVQGIKNAAARATRKATEAPRKVVKAVRNKTASALSSLADKIKTEGIELDAFDTVVAYLIDEGFATDFDHAQKIMTTLDSQLIEEVHQQQLEFVEAYLVTNADREGNTPAWRGYKKGKKNVKTGEPLYKAADHLKDEKK